MGRRSGHNNNFSRGDAYAKMLTAISHQDEAKGGDAVAPAKRAGLERHGADRGLGDGRLPEQPPEGEAAAEVRGDLDGRQPVENARQHAGRRDSIARKER